MSRWKLRSARSKVVACGWDYVYPCLRRADSVERIVSNDELLFPLMVRVGWDFFPSPWNGGTLLGRSVDNPESSFVGVAAPGVSLCGESGFDTAHWRRAEWSTAARFFEHAEPECFEVVDLASLRADLPDDFGEWTARATAAQIDRLRSFDLHRPAHLQAADLADLLQLEMEEAFPGELERLRGLSDVRERRRGATLAAWRDYLFERLPDLRMSQMQAFDLAGQVLGFAALYGLYRFVRPGWAPKGAHVGIFDLPAMSIAELSLFLYGLGHVLVPLAFLVWLYFRRHDSFAIIRDTLIVAGVLTVAAYLAYSPKAVYAVDSTSEVPTSALATMPALHLVIALVLGFFGLKLSKSLKACFFWLAYPAFVTLVLVVSQSRYPLLTIVFATATAAVAWLLSDRVVPRLRPLVGR
jgi:hypothetical protein